MPYRQGYSGDYRSGYRGGLGLALLGGFAKKALGRTARGIGRRIMGRGARQAAAGAATLAGVGVVTSMMSPRGMQPRLPVPLPGGSTLNVGRLAPGGVPAVTPGECPKGMRLNKSDYFLKDGTFIPKGSKCVSYRRRNPANGQALRRAIGRAQSFDRLVKRNRKALRSLSRI